MNVKHILLDAEDITVGAFVTARLNSRKYRGKVKDLLEWSAPQEERRKKGVGSTESSMVPGSEDGLRNKFQTYGQAGIKSSCLGRNFKERSDEYLHF